ncbi:MAG TPA: hypothetical protein VJB65_02585 [Patescibacteria group bacterium]|nr:hypothetical protein [Patescibacteria group bacterium]
MPQKKKQQKTSQNFADIFKEFGAALAEVFDDPKLKQKAKELGQSAVVSAKTLGKRFQDKEVQKRFKNAGKAAERFGKDIVRFVKEKKK